MTKLHPVAVVPLGRPGSGKGVVSGLLKSKGYVILTMSMVLHEKAKADPFFAEKYKSEIELMKMGDLFPDQGVIEAFKWKISTLPENSNLVLDGCIRTANQANFIIDLLMAQYRMKFLYVDCHKKTAARRILFSRVKEYNDKGLDLRSDDLKPKIVLKRQRLFEQNLRGVFRVIMDYQYDIFPIDAEKPKEEVIEQVQSACFGCFEMRFTAIK